MLKNGWVCVLGFVCLFAAVAGADVILWGDPYDYVTISNAVKAALHTDRVLISTGTYNEIVVVAGKNISLEGGYNENCTVKVGGDTVIDGSEAGKSVLQITNATVDVMDLQITGGHPYLGNTFYGAGVRVDANSQVTLSGCLVDDNEARGHGGGIYVDQSSLTLTNTDVRSNRAYNATLGINPPDGRGGGIYGTGDSDLLLVGTCRVSHNHADDKGGGIYVVAGAEVVADTAQIYIRHNDANSGGGLAAANAGSIKLQLGCVVAGNLASDAGGGMLIYNSATGIVEGGATIIGTTDALGGPNMATNGNGGAIAVHDARFYLQGDAVVRHNSAFLRGGGIYLSNAYCRITDGASVGYTEGTMTNRAAFGGGIYSDYSSELILDAGGEVKYGYATMHGGGIYARSQSLLTFDDAILRNCRASSGNGGGIYADNCMITGWNFNVKSNYSETGNGGGLYAYHTDTTLQSCMFTNNAAGDCGGGLAFLDGDLLLKYTDFGRNSALNGGALYLENCIATGATVRLYRNVATNDGGGIFVTNADLYISDSEFYRNLADRDQSGAGNGGGICLYADSALRIHPPSGLFISTAITEMETNGAAYGGAIYAKDSLVDIYFPMSTTLGGQHLFMGNQALQRGGAIYVDGSVLNVTNGATDFDLNQADDHGGAIYAKNSALNINAESNDFFGLLSVNIHNNQADGNGGGLCATLSTLTLYNVNFSYNDATNYSGGMDLSNCELDGELLRFVGNRSLALDAGALYGYQTEGRLKNILVQSNSAQQTAGGMRWTGADLSLRYADILDNDSSSDGGGLFFSDCSAGLVQVLCEGNTAISNGGAIFATGGASVGVTNLSLASNRAFRYGGGVCLKDGSHISLYDFSGEQQVVSNRALDGGGFALLGASDLFMFGNTRVRWNDAEARGGAFFLDEASTATVRSVYIQDNTATNYGGGIYARQDSFVEMDDCLLAENRAGLTSGGGMRLYNARGFIDECTIISNDPSGIDCGGTAVLTARLCIAYGNTSVGIESGYDVTYSCVQGGYAGTSNFNENPLIFSEDYHLTYLSPCRSKGPFNMGYDVDGESRSGICDIGFDEFVDIDGDHIPSIYETGTGVWSNEMDTGTQPDDPDSDGDGQDDGVEWVANTDPNNPDAYFHIMSVVHSNDGTHVTWFGGTNAIQRLQYCEGPALTNWQNDTTFYPPTPVTNSIIPMASGTAVMFRVTAEQF